jgi:hypothetical protein
MGPEFVLGPAPVAYGLRRGGDGGGEETPKRGLHGKPSRGPAQAASAGDERRGRAVGISRLYKPCIEVRLDKDSAISHIVVAGEK